MLPLTNVTGKPDNYWLCIHVKHGYLDVLGLKTIDRKFGVLDEAVARSDTRLDQFTVLRHISTCDILGLILARRPWGTSSCQLCVRARWPLDCDSGSDAVCTTMPNVIHVGLVTVE